MKKIPLLIAGGIGYVLGARAGRERYDQIVESAQRFRSNPDVQKAADRATDVVTTQAAAAAETAKEKAGEAASAVQDKVDDLRSDDSSTGTSTGTGTGSHAAAPGTNANPSGS